MHPIETLLSEFSQKFYKDDFASLKSLNAQISDLLSADRSLFRYLNSEYVKFQEDSKYYEQVLTHLRSPDWQNVSASNEISVEALNSGADFYTKASVLIRSGIVQTLSVLNEIDLLPSWIHALSQTEVIDNTTVFKRLVKYTFWFPWPLNNRECYIDFSAYPVAEEQSILIIMRSPISSYMDIEIPESNPNVQRMVIPLGCIQVKSVLPSLTQVTILVQANSNLNYKPHFLPQWLLEFGQKQMMYFLMDSLRITAQNFSGSEYENRVNQKPEIYGFLKEILIGLDII